MLALSAAAPMAFGPSVSAPANSAARAAAVMQQDGPAELVALSNKLNPQVGYWNPLNLGDVEPKMVTIPTFDKPFNTRDAAIGFLRHAEIKHGRVAMAGFVGFCVQSNGICFPWKLQGAPFSGPDIYFSDIAAAGGPGDQWDALPSIAKLQILGFVLFMEVISETPYALEQSGMKHYMRGGKPGAFPELTKIGIPHPIPLNLFDPFGFTKKMSPERKEKALLAEINNGRLAMIGLFGLLSASKGLIVPGLDSLGITPYAGEYMAPFSASDTNLPYVADMLTFNVFSK